jgi:hypothetical protein
MEPIFAARCLQFHMHQMACLQQTTKAQSEIDFDEQWCDFFSNNVDHLRGQFMLQKKLHMLFNPRYAEFEVRSNIESKVHFWVNAYSELQLAKNEMDRLMNSAREVSNSVVVPMSVLRGFSRTWLEAVAEALIDNHGKTEVRTAFQSNVYKLSRSNWHQLRASCYNLRTEKKRRVNVA